MNTTDEINTLDDYKKKKRCIICNSYMIGGSSRKYCFCINCFKKLPNELILQFNDAENVHDIVKIKGLIESGINILKKLQSLQSHTCLVCNKKVEFLLRHEAPICAHCREIQPDKWKDNFIQAVKKKRDDIKLKLIDMAITGNYDYVMEHFLSSKYGSFEYLGGHPDFPNLQVVGLTEKPEGIMAFDIINERILFIIEWDKITSISADTQRIEKSSHGLAALGILANRSDYAILGAVTRKEKEMHFLNIA